MMDHSIAVTVLKDELDQASADADYLSSGIASMMLGKLGGSKNIREDALIRWRRKLDRQQTRIDSLRTSINFLEHHSLKKGE
jgi:hypothetical protein